MGHTIWLAGVVGVLGCRRLPVDTDVRDPLPFPDDTADTDVPEVWTNDFDDDPGRIQLGTFNVEWLSDHLSDPDDFTPRNAVDVGMVGHLVQASGLDVVIVQEVEGTDALELLGLDARYAVATGESGWSQNVGFVWRTDRVTIADIREVVLPGTEFPSKDLLVGTVRSLDGAVAFTLVGVHLQPYPDDESAAYRLGQVTELTRWLREGLPVEAGDALARDVIVGGDFNDTLAGLNAEIPALAPLLADADLSFATAQAPTWSYIPYTSLIDHLVLSASMRARWVDRDDPDGCRVVSHDQLEPWCCYPGGWRDGQHVSDHRPVWIDLSLAP